MVLKKKNFIFIFLLFIYLFLAVLGLHCCVQAFSSCGEEGLLSCCGAQALGPTGSVVLVHGHSDPKKHVESSRTRD